MAADGSFSSKKRESGRFFGHNTRHEENEANGGSQEKMLRLAHASSTLIAIPALLIITGIHVWPTVSSHELATSRHIAWLLPRSGLVRCSWVCRNEESSDDDLLGSIAAWAFASCLVEAGLLITSLVGFPQAQQHVPGIAALEIIAIALLFLSDLVAVVAYSPRTK